MGRPLRTYRVAHYRSTIMIRCTISTVLQDGYTAISSQDDSAGRSKSLRWTVSCQQQRLRFWGGLRNDWRDLACARRCGPSKAKAAADVFSPPSVLTVFGISRIGRFDSFLRNPNCQMENQHGRNRVTGTATPTCGLTASGSMHDEWASSSDPQALDHERQCCWRLSNPPSRLPPPELG
jgi:hypothetical protein